MTASFAARRYSVLHFDDEVDERELFAMDMEALGFEVESARAPEEVVARVAERDFDAVVLDVMQHADLDAGIELCKRLKSEPTLGQAKIVMLSNRDDEMARDRSRKAGADAYVVKGSAAECGRKLLELLG